MPGARSGSQPESIGDAGGQECSSGRFKRARDKGSGELVGTDGEAKSMETTMYVEDSGC